MWTGYFRQRKAKNFTDPEHKVAALPRLRKLYVDAFDHRGQKQVVS